jgi:hypothetical protein
MLDAINTNKSSNQGCEWSKLFYLDEFHHLMAKKGVVDMSKGFFFGKKT